MGVEMNKELDLKIEGIDNAWGDLRRWLTKDSAGIDTDKYYERTNPEEFTNASDERLEFVTALRDELQGSLVIGLKVATIRNRVNCAGGFIAWVDSIDAELTMDQENLESLFRAYDEMLYHNAWVKHDLAKRTVALYIDTLARMLSSLLDQPLYNCLLQQSKTIKSYKRPRNTSVSRSAEKQHLADTRKLGHYCVELAKMITIDSVYSQLPIKPRENAENQTAPLVGSLPFGLVNSLNGDDELNVKIAQRQCKPIAWSSKLPQARSTLANLRVMAEFMIFIYQTGMNVTQALRILRESFKYSLQGESDWQVSSNKARRKGDVSFTIYKDYKGWFKQYIKFVDHFFPNDDRLFPIANRQDVFNGMGIKYSLLRNYLDRDGIPWVPPRIARNTRVNFIARLSGDPSLNAEIAQHSIGVFKDRYELPSQQRALTAVTDFWNKDPISLIQSGCSARPEPTLDKPEGVVEPDCQNQSGCLWCKDRRDINSEAYVWNLASFRRLKIIEALSMHASSANPALLAVDKLTHMIEEFKGVSTEAQEWVVESIAKVEEGDYHPSWVNILRYWEGE